MHAHIRSRLDNDIGFDGNPALDDESRGKAAVAAAAWARLCLRPGRTACGPLRRPVPRTPKPRRMSDELEK